MEWILEDVEETSRMYPESFFIPAAQERMSQEIGRMVRLHFVLTNPAEGQPRAERMWVEIIDRDPVHLRYKGVLTNTPGCLITLQAGDVVEFEPKHIAQTLISKGDPLWLEIGEKAALATERCFLPGKAVRWMYREQPDREEDSGWRLFTGEEDDDDLNNPDNTRIVRVARLLDLDPSLLEPLKGEVGTAFERTGKDGAWVEVNDWEGPEE